MRKSVRTLGVVLALVLTIAGCAGGSSLPTTAPAPSSTTPPSPVPAGTVEAVVDTTESKCNSQEITDGCWLPLYAKPSTQYGPPMNLSQQVAASCTKANTTRCWPQPVDTVAVACMVISEGQIWFGVKMPADRVLAPDSRAVRTTSGEVIGFARAHWFRLANNKEFPQSTCQ